jgi:hypothetical protein
MKGVPMHRDHQPNSEDAEASAYTFHFQMTNEGGRQACSVKVRAPTVDQARSFVRQNWPTIESLTRDHLASRSGGPGQPSWPCLDIAGLAD